MAGYKSQGFIPCPCGCNNDISQLQPHQRSFAIARWETGNQYYLHGYCGRETPTGNGYTTLQRINGYDYGVECKQVGTEPARCHHRQGGLLATDQRGGKTGEAAFQRHLTHATWRKYNDPAESLPDILISPATNKQDLMEQFQTYEPGIDPAKVIMLTNGAEAIQELRALSAVWTILDDEQKRGWLFCCHYNMFSHAKADDFVTEMKSWRYGILFCDQIEMAENETSKTYKAIQSLTREVTFGMTGEPVQNGHRIDYVWGIAQIIQPGPFARQMTQPGKKCTIHRWIKNKAYDDGCAQARCPNWRQDACTAGTAVDHTLDLFRAREDSPFWQSKRQFTNRYSRPYYHPELHDNLVGVLNMSRITREELGMVEVEPELYDIQATPEQLHNYMEYSKGIAKLIARLKEEHGDDAKLSVVGKEVGVNVLTLMNFLTRCLTDSPADMMRDQGVKAGLPPELAAIKLDGVSEDSAKFTAICEFYDNMPRGDKLIVFSHYTGFLRRLRQHFEAQGRKVAYIDGSVPTDPPTVRREIVKEFFKPDCDIFIGSRAAKAGIDLSGDLEPWQTMHVIIPGYPVWNPADVREWFARPSKVGVQNAMKGYILCARSASRTLIDHQSAKRLFSKQVVSDNVTERGRKRGTRKFDLPESLADFEAMLQTEV